MVPTLMLIVSCCGQPESPAITSARGVLTRLLHGRAADFLLTEIPSENGLDVFIVEAKMLKHHVPENVSDEDED